MGEILIRTLLQMGFAERSRIIATTRRRESLDTRVAELGIRGTLDNPAAAMEADVILLCVKPLCVPELLSSLRGRLTRQTVISVAAGVTTRTIEEGLGSPVSIVRAMPNMPCLLRTGMTALAPGTHAKTEHLTLAQALFGAMGRTLILEERHMDAVTGLSGSGPAYLYLVLEALIEGGVVMGLSRDTATELAAQTMAGAARMVLEMKEHPARLRDAVTTPAGCAIEGMLELEAGGVRAAFMRAVVQATRRATQLSKGGAS